MSKIFEKSVKIGDRVVMEAYDDCVGLWDSHYKHDVYIKVEDFELFLSEFKQMVVELTAYRESIIKTDNTKNEELVNEIMLDKLSVL